MHLNTLSRTPLDKGSAHYRNFDNKSKQLISDKNNVYSTNSNNITIHIISYILTDKGSSDHILQLLNIMGQIIIIMILMVVVMMMTTTTTITTTTTTIIMTPTLASTSLAYDTPCSTNKVSETDSSHCNWYV
jgi:hypothetical protein